MQRQLIAAMMTVHGYRNRKIVNAKKRRPKAAL
jgi:hypothetical protein